jgi:hypothetical protein
VASARAALALGLVVSAFALTLDATFVRSAGPLWRDEVNSVNVVSLPTAADVFAGMHRDSFPAGWTAVLYGWKALGFGGSDAHLRGLGLVVGLILVATLWWTGWCLGIGPPVVTLVLVALSPTIVVYGSEIRGYGLAAVAMAWAFGALWSLVASTRRRRFVVALCAAVAAAQTHYLNCVLLVGVGIAASIVCLRRRDARAFGHLVVVGVLAVVSLVALNATALGYMTGTTPLEQGDWPLAWRAGVLLEALAPGSPALAWAWGVGAVAAIVGVGWACAVPRHADDVDRAIYVALSASLAPLLALVAIWQGGVPSQAWYYLSVIVLLGFAVDVGTHQLAARLASGPWIRLVAVAFVTIVAAPSLSHAVRLRLSNVDVVAARIGAAAKPGDLVVVLPWFCGISFERYYRGAAPWITLPHFEDHRFHFHALVAEKMKIGEDAIRPELARVEETLRRGDAVWVVGRLAAPDPGHSPPRLPPAPSGPKGWRAAPYLDTWELRLGELVEAHVVHGEAIPVFEEATTVPIQPWERLALTRVVGWR